jgi:nicotinamidase-related amidase
MGGGSPDTNRLPEHMTMPRRKSDLHGSAPDKSEVVLLIVDVINDLDFPEADQLARFIPKMARSLAALKNRAKAAGVPVIYVNDNFGRWRSDFRALVDHCGKGFGADLVDKLSPEHDDYFVLKPKHSGFFSSSLETLLRYLGANRLIITGIAGNFCVYFTANDAYMRDYEIVVPSDCTISNTARENRQALESMKRYLKADIRTSSHLSFHRRKTRRHSERRSPRKVPSI